MRNVGLTWGLPILTAAVILGGGYLYLHEQHQNNQVVCEAANDNRSVLRNLLVSARAQTPKARLNKRTQRFYSGQLAKLTPLDCGHFNRDSLRRQQAQGGGAPAGKKSPKQPP